MEFDYDFKTLKTYESEDDEDQLEEFEDADLLYKFIEDCKEDDFVLEALDDGFLWNFYSSDFDFGSKNFEHELDIQALIIRDVINVL